MKLLSKLPSHHPPCTAHLFWQNWEIKFLCSAHVTPGTIKETHGTWRYGIKSGLGKGNSQNAHVAWNTKTPPQLFFARTKNKWNLNDAFVWRRKNGYSMFFFLGGKRCCFGVEVSVIFLPQGMSKKKCTPAKCTSVCMDKSGSNKAIPCKPTPTALQSP